MITEVTKQLCKFEYKIGELNGQIQALWNLLNSSGQSQNFDKNSFSEITQLCHCRNQAIYREILLLKAEYIKQNAVDSLYLKIGEMEYSIQAQHTLLDNWITSPMKESDAPTYYQVLLRLLSEEYVKMKEALHLLKSVLELS